MGLARQCAADKLCGGMLLITDQGQRIRPECYFVCSPRIKLELRHSLFRGINTRRDSNE